MKPITVIVAGLLACLACNAQTHFTKEKMRSDLELYGAEENRLLAERIKTAQPLERKQIVDVIVEMAKEDAGRVTVPFRGNDGNNNEAIRAFEMVLRVGYILSEAGQEDAILEAFGETYMRIEPDTRGALALSLAKCKDPQALQLIDESAREAMEKLLSFNLDLVTLTDSQRFEVNTYVSCLLISVEAMATSVNPSGETRARAILDELAKRSVGRPRLGGAVHKIEDEIERKLGRQIGTVEIPDPPGEDGAVPHPGKLKSKIGDSESTRKSAQTNWRLVFYSLLGISILSVGALILRSRSFHR